jgi:uncharacterized membrane protein
MLCGLRSLLAYKLLIISLAGLIAAILSIVDASEEGSVCDINSYISCTRVVFSGYSSFMGVGLSVWAIIYFTMVTCMSIAYMIIGSEELLKILWGISIAAIPIVAVLIYIEILIIRSICIYCTAMHISIAALAYISTVHMLRSGILRRS